MSFQSDGCLVLQPTVVSTPPTSTVTEPLSKLFYKSESSEVSNIGVRSGSIVQCVGVLAGVLL